MRVSEFSILDSKVSEFPLEILTEIPFDPYGNTIAGHRKKKGNNWNFLGNSPLVRTRKLTRSSLKVTLFFLREGGVWPAEKSKWNLKNLHT